MALDFHKKDNKEYLFGLDNEYFNFLSEIFEKFNLWTGLSINQYDDLELSIENQKILIKIIDKHIEENDLNRNKKQTSAILEFKGLLKYFLAKNIDLKLFGD